MANQISLEPAWIREQRMRLNLTQQRLADLSGLSLRTVARLERGENKRGGTVDALSRIVEAFEKVEQERNAGQTIVGQEMRDGS